MPRASRFITYSAPTIASSEGLEIAVERRDEDVAARLYECVQCRAARCRGQERARAFPCTSRRRNVPAACSGVRFGRFPHVANGTPLSSACNSATSMVAGARSMPVTSAPRCAIASLSRPPPQPTSRTRLPRSDGLLVDVVQPHGIQHMQRRNSPCGSHQRCAVASKRAISAGS